MAFLNTLDNGQYSPTMCIHTGVDYSVETLSYNSGVADTNSLMNERVRGSYDYVSRFPGGFFNFENYYPTVNTPSVNPTELRVYSIDGQFSGIQKQYSGKITGIYQHNSPSIINYWNSSTNISVYAESGIRRVDNPKNFGNAMPLMMTNIAGGTNENIDIEGNVYLNVLGSAIIAQGPNYVGASSTFWYYGPKADITIYGRFKINYTGTPIAVFGSNFNLFPNNGGSGVATAMTTNKNYIQVASNKLRISTRATGSTNNAFIGTDNVTLASGFYQFIYCFSQYGNGSNSYAVLYEGDDVTPLRVTASSTVTSQFGIGLQSFYSGVTLLAQPSGVIWSEFGVDNRLWGLNEVKEFNRSRLYPSSFIDESPTLLPVDNDYLNFHFPVNSVGTLGATNSGDYTDTGYSITLQPSGLSPYIYEFDRSEFNPQALRVRTVMQSVSDNPSGYLKAKIELDGQDSYWQSYPVLVPSTKSEVLMSGQLYDSNDNPLDLTDVRASGITGARLNLGAWYEDNGSSWGGDINLYSAKVELDSWVIPQPSSINSNIPLVVRGNVYSCEQSLSTHGSAIPSAASFYNRKIRGNFDYSKFECGYFNFEDYTPNQRVNNSPDYGTNFELLSYNGVYTGYQHRPYINDSSGYPIIEPYITNFHRTQGSHVAKQAIEGANNFCSTLVASGNPYGDVHSGAVLRIPSSSDLYASIDVEPGFAYPVSLSIYGRFKAGASNSSESIILGFTDSQVLNPFIFNQYQNNSLGFAQNKLTWWLQNATPYGGDYINVQGIINPRATVEFYNFLLTVDSDIRLYESYDNNPLQLVNYLPGHNLDTAAWFKDVILVPDSFTPAVCWTDFGISNRRWTELDIAEFDRSRLYPGFYIQENPYVSLPEPSGSDATYLNIHFAPYTSGQVGMLTRTTFDVENSQIVNTYGYDESDLYIPFKSGIVGDVFEFGRSDLNNRAIRVDLWAKSLSNNPSGFIAPSIMFSDDYRWTAFPQMLPQNELTLTTFSGQVFDSNGNLSNLADIPKEYITDPARSIYLGIGAWYNDYNHSVYSGDINVYSARVYLEAYCVPPMTGNALTLYVSGQQISRDGLDLFLQNSFISESCDLYINGYSSEASGCDLYIAGGFAFNNTTLYIGGMDYQNDNTTLFIEGSTVRANMPLFIYSQPPSEMSGNIPLSIWATTNPTNANAMTLYIGESAPSGVKTGGMNLYAIGPQSERVTSSMNLFLKRDSFGDNSSITLYCHNEFTQIDGELTLFMNAPSGTLGAVPVSGQMNLFIARTEGIQDGLDLFMNGPGGNEDGIPMVIEGGPPTYSSMSLMTDGIGVNYNTVKIYINGF